MKEQIEKFWCSKCGNKCTELRWLPEIKEGVVNARTMELMKPRDERMEVKCGNCGKGTIVPLGIPGPPKARFEELAAVTAERDNLQAQKDRFAKLRSEDSDAACQAVQKLIRERDDAREAVKDAIMDRDEAREELRDLRDALADVLNLEAALATARAERDEARNQLHDLQLLHRGTTQGLYAQLHDGRVGSAAIKAKLELAISERDEARELAKMCAPTARREGVVTQEELNKYPWVQK